jgi:hypothetical protein
VETIEKVVCRVEEGKTGNHIWKIVEHPESDLIGEITCYGVPSPRELPVGSTFTTLLEKP